MKLNNLGLALKANKLIFGTDNVVKGLQNNNLYLILLASDTSYNTNKKINDKAKTYNVEINNQYTTLQLSQAIGKKNIKVIGVKDEGFSMLLK